MLNRLEMLRIFVTAAEAGSFKEAAARLGVSPQAVTRAIKDLEDAQGELLFHRTTRQTRITAYGEALAARARQSVEQVDAVFAREREAGTIAGSVRIAAPVAIGRQLLVPALAALNAAHPELRFDLRLSDTHADVVDEKIDIGVRIGLMRDNRFVARRAAQQHFHVVATPGLIERVGRPRRVAQLESLPLSALRDVSTGRPWPWLFARGVQLVPQQAAFICDDPEAERDMALQGVAFAQIPDFLVREPIAAGRLVCVLENQAPPPWDLIVYRPQRGPVPARIRVVFDCIAQALAAAGR